MFHSRGLVECRSRLLQPFQLSCCLDSRYQMDSIFSGNDANQNHEITIGWRCLHKEKQHHCGSNQTWDMLAPFSVAERQKQSENCRIRPARVCCPYRKSQRYYILLIQHYPTQSLDPSHVSFLNKLPKLMLTFHSRFVADVPNVLDRPKWQLVTKPLSLLLSKRHDQHGGWWGSATSHASGGQFKKRGIGWLVALPTIVGLPNAVCYHKDQKKLKLDENGKYITSDDIAYFVSGCREVAPGFLEMQPKHPAKQWKMVDSQLQQVFSWIYLQ